MHTVTLEKKYDYSNRLFALCESCYWTATICMKIERFQCPICLGKDVALIPLGSDEKYEYSLAPDHGLQLKFSLLE